MKKNTQTVWIYGSCLTLINTENNIVIECVALSALHTKGYKFDFDYRLSLQKYVVFAVLPGKHQNNHNFLPPKSFTVHY